jgi:hypothetical protein
MEGSDTERRRGLIPILAGLILNAYGIHQAYLLEMASPELTRPRVSRRMRQMLDGSND